MLVSRQTDHVEIREYNATVVGWGEYPHKENCPARGKTCHKGHKTNHFAKNSADLPLLESSTSSGESSRKVGTSRNTIIRGN